MSISSTQDQIASLRPLILATESREDFEALRMALRDDIKPRGIIETTYLDDVASVIFEIQRLRRCKITLLDSRIRSINREVLTQVTSQLRLPTDMTPEQIVEYASEKWCSDPSVRKQFDAGLDSLGAGTSAVEAQAIQEFADDLADIDRMIISLEIRREAMLRSIAKHQKDFAKRLRKGSDRVIAGELNGHERPEMPSAKDHSRTAASA